MLIVMPRQKYVRRHLESQVDGDAAYDRKNEEI